MSPTKDNTTYITTPSGNINYAYYEKQARVERSETFSAITPWLKRQFSGLRQRLSITQPMTINGLAASPCS